MAIVWTSILIVQFFWSHRAFTVLTNWVGFPLTLVICLQHIELLKMFVCLSEYWTTQKCKKYQVVMIVLHILITIPAYVWVWGYENDVFVSNVIYDLLAKQCGQCELGCYCTIER
jgi:hypothetical protein